MTNQNNTQYVTKAAGLRVMIGRCSLDINMRMLVVLLSGIQTMDKLTIQIIGYNAENVQGNIINLQFTVILEATQHKESIEKE